MSLQPFNCFVSLLRFSNVQVIKFIFVLFQFFILYFISWYLFFQILDLFIQLIDCVILNQDYLMQFLHSIFTCLLGLLIYFVRFYWRNILFFFLVFWLLLGFFNFCSQFIAFFLQARLLLLVFCILQLKNFYLFL